MKTLSGLLIVAALAAIAWRMLPPPATSEQPVRISPTFAYGVGEIEAIDSERGVVTIRRISYIAEDKRQLAGLRPMEKVEFQVRRDGGRNVVTDIRLRGEPGDQADVWPACVFSKHSGRATLSQTASARSAAPPSAT